MRRGKFLSVVVGIVLVFVSCTTSNGVTTANRMGGATGNSVPAIMTDGRNDELAFIDALGEWGFPVYTGTLQSPESLTLDEALMHTLAAVDMTELAQSFPPEKSLKILSAYGIPGTGDPHNDRVLAAALVIQIIDPSWYAMAAGKDAPDADDLGYLLLGALDFKGDQNSFLGRISDPSIYKSLTDSWKKYSIVQGIPLLDTVDEAVIEGVVTGYNILNSRDNIEANPDLTIAYGHNDIKHALQLLGLLASEGVDGNVGFQGKTSAFLYLEEWGEPVESDTFKVKEIPNGNYVAYAKEYNLILEFDTAADKDEFNRIILAYAKKDVEDEPGLIYASWWQPLYFSSAPMGEGYRTITDHVITSGTYEAHPFSLNKDAETVEEGFRGIDAAIEMESGKFWVNQAFYNYLTGDFK